MDQKVTVRPQVRHRHIHGSALINPEQIRHRVSSPASIAAQGGTAGPENPNGIRAGQYINDIGTPLFQRFVQLLFDVAKDEGLPSRDDIVVAHTWWYAIFGLATSRDKHSVITVKTLRRVRRL